MQVQGPMAARTVEKLVGSAVYDIKYYWIEEFEIGDIPVVISRTGWTAIPGFEINLLDGSRGDDLWNAVAEAGEESASALRLRARLVGWKRASSTTART